jgi:hypothetical protein
MAKETKELSHEWEQVCAGTTRLQVIGGWIVCRALVVTNGASIALVFVPDPDWTWMIV